ncbi:MAG TPA: hypothetical protein VHM25_23130, partial [Polyangiaceae bacterium]|nr:hypothetical protein [Polyangiaceae bacterium]
MLQWLCSYRRDRARGGLGRASLGSLGALALLAGVACGVDNRTLESGPLHVSSGGSAGSVSIFPEGGDDGGDQLMLPRCNY